jgi:ankyrin repeat protein
MHLSEQPDLFQLIRLGVAPDDIDKQLVEQHVQDVNEYQQTLLHEAISHKQAEYTLFLLQKGVNVQQQDYRGATALHFAAEDNLPEPIIHILSYKADPNTVDCHGNTPLRTAVFNARGDYRVVKLLIEAGADPNKKNKYGKSPLDFAIQIKDEELQQLLRA